LTFLAKPSLRRKLKTKIAVSRDDAFIVIGFRKGFDIS